jgi:hypothetical protein
MRPEHAIRSAGQSASHIVRESNSAPTMDWEYPGLGPLCQDSQSGKAVLSVRNVVCGGFGIHLVQ